MVAHYRPRHEGVKARARPRVLRPAARGSGGPSCPREAPGLEHGARAGHEGFLLPRIEEIGDGPRQGAGQRALHVGEERARDGLAAEVPDHRAQLHLLVKRQAIVDGVDGAVVAGQAVAALAVGVIGEQIEDADALEPIAVLGVLAQREVVLLEIGGHEELDRSLAIRAVTADGGRHQAPAERLGEVIGGDLALVEARGKSQRGRSPRSGL